MSPARKNRAAHSEAMVRRILIADDNAVIRRTLRDLFRQESDFEVCSEAKNGWEAVVKAGELHPDLIVLDFSMPFINGLDAARILKRMMPSVPLILFSLYTNYLGDEARSAGIAAIVSKSEPATTLLGIARTLLHQAAA